MKNLLVISIALVLAACTTAPGDEPAPADAPVPMQTTTPQAAEAAPAIVRRIDTQSWREGDALAPIEAFRPAPVTQTRFDYGLWDDILGDMIFHMGPSLRKRASAPLAGTGTNISSGHDSPYRMEGNRFMFSQLDDNLVSLLTEYRQDLERIANEISIPALPRNEQLVFWLNFHNVLMTEQIAVHYPVEFPSQIRPNGDGVPLNEAKLVTIDGEALSLRDIRERIVYAYWDDPVVIYGFWRGTVGGPGLQSVAYRRGNVSDELDAGAEEFVNSLRGVNQDGRNVYVSALYYEAAPYFFPDFKPDLRRHLLRFADTDVRDLVSGNRPIRQDRFEERVADLAGGNTGSSGRYLIDGVTGDVVGDGEIPPNVMRMLRELDQKLETMRRQNIFEGRRRGRVIIEDEVTEEDAPEID